MRTLAKKGGLLWVFLAMMPFGSYALKIGSGMNMSEYALSFVVIPLVAIQLISIFMMVCYRKEIWN